MKPIKKIAAILVLSVGVVSNVQAVELNVISSFYGWVTSLTTGEKPDPSSETLKSRTTGEKPDPKSS